MLIFLTNFYSIYNTKYKINVLGNVCQIYKIQKHLNSKFNLILHIYKEGLKEFHDIQLYIKYYDLTIILNSYYF